MTIDNTTIDTPALDRAIITMQALEELLHDLPEGPRATAMHVLAATVTNALTVLQFTEQGEAG